MSKDKSTNIAIYFAGRERAMEVNGHLFFLLNMINSHTCPVGAGSAHRALCNADYQVSEATAGRLLRELDEKGFTEKKGFKGRVLTNEGREYLDALNQEQNRLIFGQKLVSMVNSRSKAELLDILVARRAIERELARLAAENITDQQLAAMEEIVNRYLESENGVEEGDVAFHDAMATAAGNKVLKAALDLIRQGGQLSPVFGYIRTHVHSQIFTDHYKVYQAIAKRDPDAAEQAMSQHLENIMADVQKYWSMAHREENNLP
jgi:GntR family transcriptional regulator, transcriptional repressor for pyruvate dehydrogenase complex